MALITLTDLTIGFRGPPLLDSVNCRIDPGQRIGLLGRNGAGKTTLMRLLCGEVEPDHGSITLAPDVRVGWLRQDVPQDQSGPIHDVISRGHPERGTPESEWKVEQQVAQIQSRMNLDGDQLFETLSSGMKRRVLLAQALVAQPDLLLLDEPTNHLDIEAIQWLEQFLLGWRGTLLFVTHDRVFLQNLATRILEIDRGHLFDWSCDYQTFLRRKEEALAAEQKQEALFEKKLAEEEAWIRQGIKARRTRNEGRVRALEQMRRQWQERRKNPGKVRMEIQQGARSGTLVADVEQVAFSYGDRPILDNFSTTILRGDKVGIIGPNGVGKTTLLRILLGKLTPQQGTVRLGTNLQVAYFDQLREQLDDQKSVADNIADGYDSIQVGDQSRHVIGYLQDFLFTPERARTPVRFLSGGERNRVLLARLFAKPANVIVLDEPTNDLDAETLELLEDRLMEFTGTVLVVSHDRAFLNNIATSTIAFDDGQFREYVGGYDDWIRQREQRQAGRPGASSRKSDGGGTKQGSGKGSRDSADSATTKATRSSSASAGAGNSGSSGNSDSSGNARRRLTYKEKQELAGLPEQIEQLELELAELHAAMAQPEFYQQPGEQIAEATGRLKALEDQLASNYERWEALDALAQ